MVKQRCSQQGCGPRLTVPSAKNGRRALLRRKNRERSALSSARRCRAQGVRPGGLGVCCDASPVGRVRVGGDEAGAQGSLNISLQTNTTSS